MRTEDYTRVSEILGIFQNYASVDKAKLKKSQDIGTLIHAAIESFFKDEFIPLDARKAPFFNSFLSWADSLHPRPIASETRLYDHSLRITGQFDLTATIDGVPYLIDFKTGSWAHPEIWELQMTWYRYLLEVNDLPRPNNFMVVQLSKDGNAPILHEFEYKPSTLEICKYALECYRFFKKGLVAN